LYGGLLFAATISVLPVVCFALNVRANTPKEASGPQDARVPAQNQKSDSAPDKPRQTRLQLADGTPVRLKFARKVVSSQVIAGEKIPLEVVEPVLVGKLVTIPQHSAEEAIVTMAQAGRSTGRGGNLQFKVESIRLADGEIVPVRPSKDAKDAGKQVAVSPGAAQPRIMYWLATTLVFDFKGKDAIIPAGTEVITYIAGDFPLDASKFQNADASLQEKDKPQ
jgi:hypothetical protein